MLNFSHNMDTALYIIVRPCRITGFRGLEVGGNIFTTHTYPVTVVAPRRYSIRLRLHTFNLVNHKQVYHVQSMYRLLKKKKWLQSREAPSHPFRSIWTLSRRINDSILSRIKTEK